MLGSNLYQHLLEKAAKGEVLGMSGGPNCRTWSILLHYPRADGAPGQPLRGRHEPECWGLPGLPEKDATKVDDDRPYFFGGSTFSTSHA